MSLLALFVEVGVIVVCNFVEWGGVEGGDPVESIFVGTKEFIQLFETAWNFGEFARGEFLLFRGGVVGWVEQWAEEAGYGGEEAEPRAGRVIGLHECGSKCRHTVACCFSDDNIILILYFERISMKKMIALAVRSRLNHSRVC